VPLTERRLPGDSRFRVLHGSYEDGLESPERKLEWFLSLTVEERLEVLEGFRAFLVEVNPGLQRYHGEHDSQGSVRVLRRT